MGNMQPKPCLWVSNPEPFSNEISSLNAQQISFWDNSLYIKKMLGRDFLNIPSRASLGAIKLRFISYKGPQDKVIMLMAFPLSYLLPSKKATQKYTNIDAKPQVKIYVKVILHSRSATVSRILGKV